MKVLPKPSKKDPRASEVPEVEELGTMDPGKEESTSQREYSHVALSRPSASWKGVKRLLLYIGVLGLSGLTVLAWNRFPRLRRT